MSELMRILTKVIGLSSESATVLIDEFGELAVQMHALHCLYAMDKGRVTPGAIFVLANQVTWSLGRRAKL